METAPPPPPRHPQAAELPADLALLVPADGGGARAGIRAPHLPEHEADPPPVPGGVEGTPRRPVLYASEIRTVEPADPGHCAAAAGRDPHPRRHHGAHLVAFLELTKPRITQLVLLTAATGFYLGSEAGVRLALLLHTLVGTALAAGRSRRVGSPRAPPGFSPRPSRSRASPTSRRW